MGSCVFNLKAQFKTKREAAIACRDLIRFLQQNRDAGDNLSTFPQKVIDIHLYPRVKEYLQIINSTRKEDDVQYYGDDEPYCKGRMLIFSSEVSHLGSWDNLKTFIQTKYHPIRVVWGSEEDGDTLGALNLYPWEDIVLGILKYKKTLPFLLGIHEDFDELISMTLRKKGKI